MESYDPDIVAEFMAEANEELATAEQLLVALDSTPAAKLRPVLDGLFRSFHTIKSSSGYFDFEELTELAHAIEGLLDRIRSQQLSYTPEVGDTLLAAVDGVKVLLQRVAEHDWQSADLVQARALIASVQLAGGSGQMSPAVGSEAIGHLDQIVALLGDAAPLTQEFRLLRLKLAHAGEVKVGESTPDIISRTFQASERDELEPAEPAGPKKGALQQDKSIRVPESRLDQFLEHVGNMVRLRHVVMSVERLLSRHVFEPAVTSQVHDMTTTFVKESERLQSSIMTLRQVPVGSVLRRLPRVARDVARSLGKTVEVFLEGDSTEVDKSLLETLENPLVHLVRNAVDHGIEMPEARLAAGKPAQGTIRISVDDGQDLLCVVISDDGGGVDKGALRRKAVSCGVIDARAQLGERELLDLMFSPGLSTAAQVTEVSGRGVGMDVVKQKVNSQGGTIEITSIEGKGTTFRLLIPRSVNTAIASAVTVSVGCSWLAVPMKKIAEVVAVDNSRRSMIERMPRGVMIRLRSQVFPLLDVGEILGLGACASREEFAVLVADTDHGRIGFAVDRVEDITDVVTQRVDYLAKHHNMFAEACLWGDGRIAMLLDVDNILATTQLGAIPAAARVRADVKQVEGRAKHEGEYLIVESRDGSWHALELDSVFRLERISASRVQSNGGEVCMTYEGSIVVLIAIDGGAVAAQAELDVVIVRHGEHRMGLVVAKILDVSFGQVGPRLAAAGRGGKELVVLRERVVEVVALEMLLARFTGKTPPKNALPTLLAA